MPSTWTWQKVAALALLVGALVSLGVLAAETYGAAVSHALAVLVGAASAKLTGVEPHGTAKESHQKEGPQAVDK